MVQFCEPNDECQHGQHDDGDLAGTWSFHVLLYSTSISLNRPRTQLPELKSAGSRTHWVIEVGSVTLVFLVLIVTRVVSVNGGRLPMPRAKSGEPGWTSWRGHDIVVYPIEFNTCPRVLGVSVSCVLWMCRWQGKYGKTLGDEPVADQKLYEERVEGGR